ncbi:hypothetical protein RHODO2019_05525 [Rhodococcus antarcticus]|uniref:Beta-lactamase family protein n=1 Tax=Rhodococcus antarcticus TaxID=2987751 RepID=A0ABY6P318_9NOCA|nr:hypothetical protein [Rhodococcus antarcticus]UZJ25894.1 hypothetical protein RHODO2019_05525 [Rhodococcus antarcticus]
MQGGVLRARFVAAAAVLVTALTVTATPAAAAAAAGAAPDDVAAAVAYAHQQGYRSAVAVLDMNSGGYWTAGDPDATYSSESLIKLFIATRLLADGNMSGFNETTAYKMITQSDDASANTLYGRTGGDANITWVEQRYGIPWLGSPPPQAGYWGATPVTAHGMVSFYAAVRADPVVWPWLSNAIHNATPYGSDGFYQFFGIPSATTGAGIKQGWGNDTPTGVPEQNSTGVVNGDRFAVAILTQGPGYGGALSDVVTQEARLALPGGVVRLPAPPPRLVVLGTDGLVYAREGGRTAPWVTETSNGVEVGSAGTRLAVVDKTGLLMVKEGGLTAGWVTESGGVAHVAVTTNRLGAVGTDGSVYVKEGNLYQGWVAETSGARSIGLSGDRVAVLTTDGTLMVKQGNLYAPWVVEATGVTQASVDGTRIGVVTTDGTVIVKEGGLYAPWVVETAGAHQVVLSAARLGVVLNNGTLMMKDGDLFSTWVVETDGTSSVSLAGQRLAALRGTEVWAKDGSLYSPWVVETGGAIQAIVS